MIWFFYNVLFAVGYTLMVPYFLIRMARRGGYRSGFSQRFARYDADLRARLAERQRIWIHAVSVGEMYVALRVVDELRRRDPACSVVVTTTTSTGHRIAREALSERDVLLYMPADFPWIVRRAIRAMNPSLLVLIEGEIWPNMIREAKRQGVPVALLNGRMSASSHGGYRRLPGIMRRVLEMIDVLMVQGPPDAERFISLGAPVGRVRTMGTTKYDARSPDPSGIAAVQQYLQTVGWGADDPVLMGGSTWAGEEAVLMGIYKRLREKVPTARLLLAPRHAERAADIMRDIEAAGLSYVRRSLDRTGETVRGASPDVVLADTTGEMQALYAAATLVFVGKSLLHEGGQDFIEPAQVGRAVIVGPHLENFPVVSDELLGDEAIVQVAGEEELADAIVRYMTDDAVRRVLEGRAAEAVAKRAGVVKRSVDALEELLHV